MADAPLSNQLSLSNETMHHSHQKPPVNGAEYNQFSKLSWFSSPNLLF